MKPIILKENNCYYLSQDLSGMDLYERTRAIKRFVNSDTKILEECVNNEIKAIFKSKGINAYSNDESVLKTALDTFNRQYGKITIIDLFKNPVERCEKIDKKNDITIVIEDNRFIVCGMEIKIDER